jgi:hypothetical protein
MERAPLNRRYVLPADVTLLHRAPHRVAELIERSSRVDQVPREVLVGFARESFSDVSTNRIRCVVCLLPRLEVTRELRSRCELENVRSDLIADFPDKQLRVVIHFLHEAQAGACAVPGRKAPHVERTLRERSKSCDLGPAGKTQELSTSESSPSVAPARAERVATHLREAKPSAGTGTSEASACTCTSEASAGTRRAERGLHLHERSECRHPPSGARPAPARA